MRSNMYKRHRIPRRQPLPFGQRMCLWMMMILMAGLLLSLVGQAQAKVGIHYEVGEYPETPYRWANVNAYQVNFRAAPSLEADVVAHYSWGTCVEVVSVWDGWAEVLHHNHLHNGALYVWAEYLDIVD